MAIKLVDGATGDTTGASVAVTSKIDGMRFQAVVEGTGAVTAVATIQVSLDNVNFFNIGTITLSGTTAVTDGFYSSAPWDYVRAATSGVTGTGASVSVMMTF